MLYKLNIKLVLLSTQRKTFYEYITYICSELHASLIKLNSDETVNKGFPELSKNNERKFL